MKAKLTKWATWYMVSVIFSIGITSRVYADFSPSELIGCSQMDRNSNLLEIQRVLESRMIRERLSQLGFTEEGIQGRLYQLSDKQIHQVALRIDELQVGGDGSIGLLVAIFLVLVVSAIAWFLEME